MRVITIGRATVRRGIMPVTLAVCLMFVGLALCQDDHSRPPATANGVGGGEKYALLVGVTDYTYSGIQDLTGPANDLRLWRQTLLESYEFPEQNIVELRCDAADEHREPSKANIRQQMMRLAGSARSGDHVVILFSGHGSQQPDLDHDDVKDPEPDGMDEIFLPVDVQRADEGHTVPNAVTDDELREWLSAIRSTGASVWVIADCCYSGTLIRGGRRSTVRQVDPAVLLRQEVLDERVQIARQTRGGAESGAVDDQLGLEGIVALYAAQSSEPTIELPMPVDDVAAPVYGLLSYSACTILTRAAQNGTPLTHRELAQRLYTYYQSINPMTPVPLVEGGLQDNFVLGGPAKNRPQILLVRHGPDWKVRAGSLHGLTPGSKLAVYLPAGTAVPSTPLGYVEVDRAEAVESVVTPVAFNGLPAPENIEPGCLCRIVSIQYESQPLKLAVAGSAAQGRAERLRAALEAQSPVDETPPLTLASKRNEADWILWFDEVADSTVPQATLLPAEGVPVGVATVNGTPNATDLPQKLGTLQISLPADDRLASRLVEIARKIKRVQGLTKIAAEASTGIELDVRLFQLSSEEQAKQFRGGQEEVVAALQPLTWDWEGITLRPEQFLGVQISNPNRVAVDVTLLFIDSGYGIDLLYPNPNRVADNRILAGKSAYTAAQVTADTLGWEHLLAIALKSDVGSPPVDFRGLRQETLARMRDDRVATRGSHARLYDLLEAAAYTGSRGVLAIESADEYALRLVSFHVLAE